VRVCAAERHRVQPIMCDEQVKTRTSLEGMSAFTVCTMQYVQCMYVKSPVCKSHEFLQRVGVYMHIYETFRDSLSPLRRTACGVISILFESGRFCWEGSDV